LISLKKLSRRLLVLILLVLGLYTLEWIFIPKARQDRTESFSNQIELAFSMPILSLDPYKFGYGAQTTIFPLIYSFLLVPLEDGSFEPDLAVKWWPEEDEKTWTFVLRPEARFHDGRPVTSADALYSLRRLCESNPFLAENIDDIRCPDLHRLIVALKHPLPFFFYHLSAMPVVPRPANGRYNQDQRAIGSGPFKVHYRHREQTLVLVSFPEYYGEKPHVNAIEVVYVPDKEKIWTDFMNGRIQACFAATPENVYFMRLEPTRYRLEGGMSRSTVLLLFNTTDPLFSDRQVRRAIARMFDIEKHIQSELRGLAQPCPSPLGAFSPFLPKNARPIRFDPEEAERALAEAGWVDHDQDMFRDKDGRDFEFELLVPTTFQTEKETALYIQRALNRFGLKAHLVYKRFDRMVEENLGPGDFQACLTQHGTNPRNFSSLAGCWSSKAWGNGNFGRYRNDTVDQCIKKLLSAERPEELAEPLGLIHEHLLADQPAVWLYHRYEVHAFSRRLQNLRRPNPDFYFTFPLRQAGLLSGPGSEP